MSEKNNQVVSIIIDGSNLVRSIWDYTGDCSRGISPDRIDIKGLHETILKGRKRGKCRLFRSHPPSDKPPYLAIESLLSFRHLGYLVVTTPLTQKTTCCFKCRHAWVNHGEKSVDALIVNEMWDIAMNQDNGDELVIVSGDGDFVRAAKCLQNHGTVVKFWGVTGSFSSEITSDSTLMGGYLDPFIKVEAGMLTT